MSFSKNLFVLKRRNKIVMKEIPLVFGISGVARCGKDTLAAHLIDKLEKAKLPCVRSAFADALKRDLDDFTKQKLSISAFTEKTNEKNIIRPLLVAYGTHVCRNQVDKDFWIKKIEKLISVSISNRIITVIPDVRYENEVRWIKQQGGFVIHLTRMGMKPSNFEEKSNDPVIKKLADYKIRWKTFSDEKETCQYHINKLFFSQGWSTYGSFK